MQFEPSQMRERRVSSVLKFQEEAAKSPSFLRLTHVFEHAVYGVFVTDAVGVQKATRPKRFSWDDIVAIEAAGGQWGVMSLPDSLLWAPLQQARRRGEKPGGAGPDEVETTWRLIAPLIDHFTKERHLERASFDRAIRLHAESRGVQPLKLRRLVNRFYYFGQVMEGLQSLRRGRAPKPPEATLSINGAAYESDQVKLRKRSGPKASIARSNINSFVVSDSDILEMVQRLTTEARKNRVTVRHAHEQYLKRDFARSHPAIWQAHLDGKHPTPVSLRQFRYATNTHTLLDKETARNLRTKAARRSGTGSTDATGPAEIYEIDATGGRIVLVTSGDNPRLVATPTIYIVIDRWSRFIVSVYVSLKAPSWDEARYALLIAFSSREERFKRLNIDIDDERWPRGRICSALVSDRGSELISKARGKAIAGDLKIEPLTLPGATPNGKAVIERFLRTLKGWMAKEVKGAYADRPIDPDSKYLAKTARKITITSLAALYRELIRFVEEYNNRPHRTLKRRSAFFETKVPPTPKAAYLWGLENITGAIPTNHSDAQLQKMLMATDIASIKDGIITYKGWKYAPKNIPAISYTTSNPRIPFRLEIRIDKSFPQEIFLESENEWPQFEMVATDRRTLGIMSLEEYEELAIDARADHRILEEEQQRAARANDQKKRRTAVTIDRSIQSPQQIAQDRKHESAKIKSRLTGKPPPLPPRNISIDSPKPVSTTRDLDQRLEEKRAAFYKSTRRK